MKTEFTFKSASITVNTTNSSTAEKNSDFLISEQGAVTNKSVVIIKTKRGESTITVLWSHFSEDASLCIHWSEINQTLFIGGGCVSAVINIEKQEIIDINYPELFWAWEFVGDYILELGELDCRLYSESGKLIGEAPVDPPYEYELKNNSIEFTSIVMGKTKIELNYS